MNRLPDMGTPRCEVLSSPKQVREVLEASKRAEQVALDVQAEGPGAVGGALAGVSLCFEPGVKTGTPAFDTLLAAFLLDGKAYALEDLIADRLGGSAEEREARGNEERTRQVCARAE